MLFSTKTLKNWWLIVGFVAAHATLTTDDCNELVMMRFVIEVIYMENSVNVFKWFQRFVRADGIANVQWIKARSKVNISNTLIRSKHIPFHLSHILKHHLYLSSVQHTKDISKLKLYFRSDWNDDVHGSQRRINM